MAIFIPAFWVLLVLCVMLYAYTRTALPHVENTELKKFQCTYLIVYLLATGADWLQGPHVYALYQSYGMTSHQIEILFVAGFGSSMVVGTVIGSFADKCGRKVNCILYGILYGLACITKHFSNFWILMVGRLLGGVATSILCSAFESWLIYEHTSRALDPSDLSTIFSHAVFGNSVVAITAGITAQYFADSFGFVAPFDISLCVLIVMCFCLVFLWTENYGDKTSNVSSSLKNAVHSIKSDPRILSLGLIQSLFEGSMYTFVLEWTPALTPILTSSSDSHHSNRGTIPHGYIFAGFMVAIMIGSSLFKLLIKYTTVDSFMRPTLLVASISLAVPILYPTHQSCIFISFVVFETCVGIFWPAMSTMRGKYVPEETRATIMNCFRVPLNLIVVCILLQNFHQTTIFKCCVMFLLLATLCQIWLHRHLQESESRNKLKLNSDDVSESL